MLEALMRTLVAEDQPFSRAVLTALLSRHGCQVDAVETAAEAAEALGTNRYALVLVDCNLPDRSGFDLVREFRAKQCERPGPAIFGISASSGQGVDEHCLGAGMDGFFAKPVDQQALVALLERVRRGEVPQNRQPGDSEPPEMEEAGRDFSQDYYRAFVQSCRDDLREVLNGLESADYQRVRNFAHRMKGVAAFANCGAVMRRAMNLEMSAEQSSHALCGQHAAAIEDALNTIEQDIESKGTCCTE